MALDLYFRINFPENSGIGPNKSEAIKLNELLNRLPIHPNETRGENFRNANRVVRKLQNLLFVNQGKGGSPNISKLDIAIWDEFSANREELSKQALEISKEVIK
ncbi:MAG: hypothetical protein Q7R34_15075 [Dehalococcoidia bacterium]|nr:hypothetical protein [Dehalococcoidia bacterium]